MGRQAPACLRCARPSIARGLQGARLPAVRAPLYWDTAGRRRCDGLPSLISPPPSCAVQHDVQLDYYGKRLATCSSDRIIMIFDVTPDQTQHQLSASFQAHEGPVWQVAWAHPKFGRSPCLHGPRLSPPACAHAFVWASLG